MLDYLLFNIHILQEMLNDTSLHSHTHSRSPNSNFITRGKALWHCGNCHTGKAWLTLESQVHSAVPTVFTFSPLHLQSSRLHPHFPECPLLWTLGLTSSIQSSWWAEWRACLVLQARTQFNCPLDHRWTPIVFRLVTAIFLASFVLLTLGETHTHTHTHTLFMFSPLARCSCDFMHSPNRWRGPHKIN